MTARKPIVRAMKARRSSKVACGCFVRPGEYIIRGPDGRWRCAKCVIASLQAADQALQLASKDVPPGARPGGQSPKEIIS